MRTWFDEWYRLEPNRAADFEVFVRAVARDVGVDGNVAVASPTGIPPTVFAAWRMRRRVERGWIG
jgi:hypothetical protein